MVGVYRARRVPSHGHVAVDVDDRAQARGWQRRHEVGDDHLHGQRVVHVAVGVVAGDGDQAGLEPLYVDGRHAVAGAKERVGERSPLVAQQFLVEVAGQEAGQVGLLCFLLPVQDGLRGQVGLLLAQNLYLPQMGRFGGHEVGKRHAVLFGGQRAFAKGVVAIDAVDVAARLHATVDVDRTRVGQGLVATLHRHVGPLVGLVPLLAVGSAPFDVVEAPTQVGPCQHDVVRPEDGVGELRAEGRPWRGLHNNVVDCLSPVMDDGIGHERNDDIVVLAARLHLAVGIGQAHGFGQIEPLFGHDHGIAVDVLLLVGHLEHRPHVLWSALGAVQRQVAGSPNHLRGRCGQAVGGGKPRLELVKADGPTLGQRIDRGAFALVERHTQNAVAVGLCQFPGHIVVGSPAQGDAVGRCAGQGSQFVYHGVGGSLGLAAVCSGCLCHRRTGRKAEEQGCDMSFCFHNHFTMRCWHTFSIPRQYIYTDRA